MRLSMERRESVRWRTRALALALGSAVLAWGAAVGAATEAPAPLTDAYGRDTPRGSVAGYLDAVRKNDYERAAYYLDLRGISEPGAELARELWAVLARTLPLDPASYSDDPRGGKEAGVSASRERLGWIELPDGKVEVLLARVKEEDAYAWKFAGVTVAQIPKLHDAYGHGVLERWLPAFFFDLHVLEIALWQWLGLLALVLTTGLLAWLGSALLVATVRRSASRRQLTVDAEVLSRAIAPARLAIACLFFRAGVVPLGLGLAGQALVATSLRVLVVVAFAWFLVRLVDALGARISRGLEAAADAQARAFIAPTRRFLKLVLIAVAGIAILDGLGFSVTAIVASLGVGGIAVALAAQKTIENLFGGVTLFADRPIRVGDFCRFGDKVGTVEEIGIRSTRVRTLDRTVVTIPNAEFSGMQIESYAARDKIRLFATLQVGYDTSPDQLRYLLVELRKLLYAHPKTLPDPCRVRLVNFGAYSIDLEVFVFIDTQDWNEFLGIREDIFLRILDVVKTSGAYFAYPSQTLYLGQDAGRDLDRTRQAEADVAAWRQAESLPLPDFPPARIEALRGTLAFPPAGSTPPGS